MGRQHVTIHNLQPGQHQQRWHKVIKTSLEALLEHDERSALDFLKTYLQNENNAVTMYSLLEVLSNTCQPTSEQKTNPLQQLYINVLWQGVQNKNKTATEKLKAISEKASYGQKSSTKRLAILNTLLNEADNSENANGILLEKKHHIVYTSIIHSF